MVHSIPSALLVAGSIPSGSKTFTKNCVNYQLDNLLIKGVVGSTIKTRQPKNVGDDRQESSTIKRVTRGPLESYTGGQKLQNFFFFFFFLCLRSILNFWELISMLWSCKKLFKVVSASSNSLLFFMMMTMSSQ